MNQPDVLPVDPHAVDGLPRRTTPTWEVELLISGVAVFSMLQLPGLLDDAIFALRPRFGAGLSSPLVIMYIYSKSAAVILAVTFVLHLLLRARWIALVGLHSIRPQGIDWSRLRLGPVGREIEQARLGNIEDAIERVDNRATTVFAIGVTLGSLLLVLTLIAGVLFAVAAASGMMADPTPLLFAFAVLMLPFMLAQVVDRRAGDRLPPTGPARRVLRGTLDAYSRLGFGLSSNPVMAMLSSRGGRARTVAVTMGLVMLAIVSVVLGYDAMREPDSLGSYALFPNGAEGAPDQLAAAHYDDQRNPARDRAVPYIQAAIVIGPYLRLVVPYQPIRDEPALRRLCRTLPGLQDAVRARTARACLQRLYAVRLDGAPVPSLHYDVGSDPRVDRPALVAMLDVRALAPGRHELQVARATAPDDKRPDASAPYRIPFWR